MPLNTARLRVLSFGRDVFDVPWKGGESPRFLSSFVAWGFLCSQTESRLTHLPLMQGVGR
jgi:hypothetical protein